MANMKNKKNALPTNQITPSGAQVSGQTGIGDSQPPRNRIVPIAHKVPMPTLISAITQPALTGITAQAASASVQVTSGASKNTPLLALAGMVGSLTTNFSRSAKDCSRPHGPT